MALQNLWTRWFIISNPTCVGPNRLSHQAKGIAMKVDLERHFQAPIKTVFERLTNFADAPRVVRGIKNLEVLTPGPVGLGTRFRETRVMFGREAVEELEVTRWEPPNLYEVSTNSHGAAYQSTFTLNETRGGTEVRLDFVATPQTLAAKVMSVVMRPMMGKVMQECAKDLDDMAAEAEAESTRSAVAEATSSRVST